MESSAAEEVESVPSSETVEAVLALEVLLVELVELLPPPEQAAMLRARVRAKKPARSFFIVSFPFIAKFCEAPLRDAPRRGAYPPAGSRHRVYGPFVTKAPIVGDVHPVDVRLRPQFRLLHKIPVQQIAQSV